MVNKDFEPEQKVNATLIKVENAYESLAKLLTLYEQSKPQKVGVDSLASVASTAKLGENVYVAPFAVIGESAIIGDNTKIYAHAVIGENVKLGESCIVYPNVTVYHDCRIGNRVILHAGSVIGADGFGFAPSLDGYEKIPQIGNVTIEDDVEIGANTCIDRATMGSTIIHRGVKLDNLIQVAHNVEVGSHTVMASQVGIAGSAKIGEWCMFGGQVGVAGHITLGDHLTVGAQSGIPGNITGNQTVMGSPTIDARNFARSSAVFKKLPEIYTTINAMQKELNELKKQLGN